MSTEISAKLRSMFEFEHIKAQMLKYIFDDTVVGAFGDLLVADDFQAPGAGASRPSARSQQATVADFCKKHAQLFFEDSDETLQGNISQHLNDIVRAAQQRALRFRRSAVRGESASYHQRLPDPLAIHDCFVYIRGQCFVFSILVRAPGWSADANARP